jgi:hypothetical protein
MKTYHALTAASRAYKHNILFQKEGKRKDFQQAKKALLDEVERICYTL